MSSVGTKTALRRTLKTRRDAVTQHEAANAASRICAHLNTLLNEGSRRVAGFSATRNEVDLTALYIEMLEREQPLCFPRVTGPGEMVFAEVSSLTDLRPGAYGIAEPIGPPLQLQDIDVFMVPGLGFDQRGYRLGFGGGYYDRALTAAKLSGEASEKVPLFVGIVYTWQVLETDLPIDEWDVRLDLLVTEAGVIDVLSPL